MLLNGGLEKAATQGMPKLPVRIANTLFVGFNHAGRLEKQNLCIRGRGLGLRPASASAKVGACSRSTRYT